MDLDYIINADAFQVIQDDIANATEIAIITVDYRGIPVTKHSRCSRFCESMRENPKYSNLCEKCDSRGGLEAARLQGPYIYKCHAGLVDFAAPIIIKGQYLGAVMAGQVLLPKDEEEELEPIVNEKISTLDLSKEEELNYLFNGLTTMTLDKVKAISKLMFHLSNYIVEEALLKISLNELNELKAHGSRDHQDSNLKNKNEEHLKKKEIHKSGEEKYEGNVLLKPAIDYIQTNYNETITMEQMASLCNVSSSYFSKLFKREINDSFPNYVNEIKVEKAKQILLESDTPIITMALDLGFSDSGYFIRVFKNLEGVTPAVYRKNHHRKK